MKRIIPNIYILYLSIFFLIGSGSFVFGQGTDIVTYSFPEQTGPATISSGTVGIEVAYGTNLNGLIATFTLSDSAVADIGGTPQESGVTPNDFSSGAVIYTITDTTDASTQDWTVTVLEAPNDSTDILTFTLPEQTSPAVIDDINHTVGIEVDYGTDLTSLTPTFTLSTGATSNPTSGTTSNYSSPFTITVTAEDGTTIQDWTVNVSEASNSENDILAYSIPEQTGLSTINNGNHTVTVTVPYGTTVTSLVATFTLSPQATATVGVVAQVSGSTPNNFTNPVIYTVEAGDGTPQDWTVTVNFAPNNETDILTYSLDGFSGTVNAGNHTVTIDVPFGTDVTDMVATFTLSDQAIARVSGSVQTSGVSSLDFSSPVIYDITAGDGTTVQAWTVTVNIAPNTETDFLTFSFPEQTGPAVINTTNHTIFIQVQYGTSPTNLVASFTLSPGAIARISGTLQTSGVTANNFTNPVTYRVIAEDGTTAQNWTVNVTVAPNFATDILTFSIPDQLGSSTINATNHSVELVMPFGTDVSNLVATFTLSSGASASVEGAPQNSGVTPVDFSSDVIYTILAENGIDFQDWTVIVSIAPNTSTGILLFSFEENAGTSTIDNVNHTIDVTVKYGSDITSLVADFTLSLGATARVNGVVQQSGVTNNDFTNPVTYRITAQDGVTFQDWVVTVYVADNTEADILAFSFAEEAGPADIDDVNRIIRINVVYNTDSSDLVATFTLSDSATARVGVVPQVSGVTSNDFTNQVTYVVTSEDGSTEKAWVVIVEVNDNTDADILTFSFPEQTEDSNIDTAAHTILAKVEYGVDLTDLVATYTLSPQAIAFVGPVRQESGVTSNDFTDTVTYLVRAGDNTTTQNWLVTVNFSDPSTETEIISFSVNNQVGTTTIDTSSNVLTVYVEQGTELDRLVATFELSYGASAYVGDSLQISGETVNDFSADSLVYTIVAQDGVTSEEYAVKVRYDFGFVYVKQPREFPVSRQFVEASARLPVLRVIENVFFYHKKFREKDWASTEVLSNEDIYSIDITRDMVGDLGMYYYFEAVDTTGDRFSLDSRQLILHYDTNYPSIPNLRFGGTVNHYQIIAIPMDLRNTNAEAVFDELGEYNIKNWRLFHYDNTATREYRSGFTNIDPGLGYWLIVREQTPITTGEGHTVRVDSITNSFDIDLLPGWNQIGNPFDIDINWDKVILDNDNLNIGRIKLFNSDSLTEASIIPRFRGGFVFLLGLQPVTVSIDPSVSCPTCRRQPYVNSDRLNSIDQPSWITGLNITNGQVTNTLSGIGMHPEAVVGKDQHDEVLLPVPDAIIPFQLAFNHPDEQYDKISLDVTATADHYIWEFEVKSFAPSQKLTISWDNRHFGDNEYRLLLNHKGIEAIIDMKEASSYTFDASGLDQFRIIFGDESFIKNELKPTSVNLGNGYPNPFRDQLTIPFTLPESPSDYRVKIEVYDLTGNLVKLLADDSYRAGYYTVNLNSVEDAGRTSKGIYIIKMIVRSDRFNTILIRKVIRQ